MIVKEKQKLILESLLENIELPDTAYEKAKARYEDIGEWLSRDESVCKDSNPHINPQGSFRLGTANCPIDTNEAYDLDITCKLREGISKNSHTQKELKELMGYELELYRVARGIKTPKEEKHRCWRLEYKDSLNFHIDIVPCIPEDESGQKNIFELMKSMYEPEYLARDVSYLTISITDDRHFKYEEICNDWEISNPEGYALWFESKMNQGQQIPLEKAQIEKLPIFKRKTPLQRSIQLLKRHRDNMFKTAPDVKPISIIITTLAARAYQGETDIEEALSNILSRMGSFVNNDEPKVPNPVNPKEDFADKWSRDDCKHLYLEENFWMWLRQAQDDFKKITSHDDLNFISDMAKAKFSVDISTERLEKSMGLVGVAPTIIIPKSHTISEQSAKPWRF